MPTNKQQGENQQGKGSKAKSPEKSAAGAKTGGGAKKATTGNGGKAGGSKR